jgi:hypothetical protein
MFAKLFNKNKHKQIWINVEYPCSDQVLTKSLINKMVNRLWNEKFKDVNTSDNYLMLMFRVRLAKVERLKLLLNYKD